MKGRKRRVFHSHTPTFGTILVSPTVLLVFCVAYCKWGCTTNLDNLSLKDVPAQSMMNLNTRGGTRAAASNLLFTLVPM